MEPWKKILSNWHLKKQKQNILKKGSIKITTKKFLILGVQDIIEPLPDVVARPANQPSVPSICEWDEFLSGILQILKKKDAFCIIIELNLQKRQSFNSRRLSYGA